MTPKKKGKRSSRGRPRDRTPPALPDADYHRLVRQADRVLAENDIEIRASTWADTVLDWFTADARDRDELACYISAHESQLGMPWARNLLRLEVFLRVGDHEAILAHYDRAMARYPRCPLVEMWVAEQIARHGADWWRARSMLLYAVEQLPDHARPRYELGFQHYLLGDFPGALVWFDQAAARLTGDEADVGAQVYYNRGLIRYAIDGDRRAAVSDIRAALRLKPDYPQARQTLRALQGKVRWVPW